MPLKQRERDILYTNKKYVGYYSFSLRILVVILMMNVATMLQTAPPRIRMNNS